METETKPVEAVDAANESTLVDDVQTFDKAAIVDEPSAEVKTFDQLGDKLEEVLKEGEEPTEKTATEDKTDTNDKAGKGDENKSTDKGEGKAAAQKGTEKVGEEGNGFTFDLPSDGKEGDTKGEDSKESSWSKVGESLGVIPKEDTFDSFKAAYEEKIQVERESAKKEVEDLNINKFTPEAQKVIKFLNADPHAKIEDYVDPLKQFDEILGLDSESINRKDLELKGWAQDKIDAKIERMKEDGSLEENAYALKQLVKNNKTLTENALVTEKEKNRVDVQKNIEKQTEKENQQIREMVSKIDKFMDGDISDEHRNYLIKKWESGDFRKRFQNDPSLVVKAMLFDAFGEKALKELKKRSYNDGTSAVTKKLSNSAVLGDGEKPGVKDNKGINPSDSPFDAWKEGMQSATGNLQVESDYR